LRFFNVFGPRQDPASPYSGVISIFAGRLRSGLPLTVHGDGGQTRDFIYVADVVRHLLAAMAHATLAGPVYNVCTGQATSVRTLAAAMAAALDMPLKIEQLPARTGDIRRSLGDPARARTGLGIAAATDLATGLALLAAAAGQPTAPANLADPARRC
jgi:UDP-glucose 4-epimerase